jgi:hypothetical protein
LAEDEKIRHLPVTAGELAAFQPPFSSPVLVPGEGAASLLDFRNSFQALQA